MAGGGCLLCAMWPALIVACVLGGFGCLIAAEQHDGHRGLRGGAWFCFGLAVVFAVLPFVLPAIGAWLGS